MSDDFPGRRFTVEEYHSMIQAGILTDEDPIELLEGFLVERPKKTPVRIYPSRVLADRLTRFLPDGWQVRRYDPITTADSEPEPNISVVRGDLRHYIDHHPFPEDVGLVVEIADTNFGAERNIKKTIYARAGIVNYWILNLIDRQVEAFSDPTGPGAKPEYRTTQVFGDGDEVPVAVGGKEIGRLKVADVRR